MLRHRHQAFHQPAHLRARCGPGQTHLAKLGLTRLACGSHRGARALADGLADRCEQFAFLRGTGEERTDQRAER